ncbi:MAG: porin [Myxococcales bacterium]
MARRLMLVLVLLSLALPAAAEETRKSAIAMEAASASGDQDDGRVQVSYKDGFRLQAGDRFQLNLGARMQFRYAYGQDGDTLSFEDLSSFGIRRARLKAGGFGYQEWFNYYFEYDFPSHSLLDWRITVEKFKWAQLRFGQWKIDYNRERVDSSGKQQFVDRSIVNRPFTLDRQIGMMVFGHLFEKTHGYVVYNVGMFTGAGINQRENDDDGHLYMGRLQWNFLGRDLKFSQSDVEGHEKPAASLSLGAARNVTNRRQFPQTKDLGKPGQFLIEQGVSELAFKWRGFSFQTEYHLKRILDRLDASQTLLMGAYGQTGYFPHRLVSAIPEPLELAVRYAFVDPDRTRPDDLLQEYSLAANWFFADHANKLTADLSHLTGDPGGLANTRFRMQWDVSF